MIPRRIEAATTTPERVAEAVAEVILAGGTAIVPTDTVYGIGCDPAHLEAVARIFSLKNRPREKPLSLHLASVAELLEYAQGNRFVALLARRMLPGPLTLLVQRPAWIDESVSAGLPSIGLRVPDHPLCLTILERTGPLAATSANMSGEPAFIGEGDESALPAADAIVLDGPTPYRAESTVIDLSTDQPRLIREGAIRLETLERYLGRIARPRALAWAFAAACAFALLLGPARADDFKHFGGFDHIESDVVNWNLETGEFSLPHPFTAVRQGTTISADHATGNTRTKILHAEGHVVIHQNQPMTSSARAAALTARPSTLTTDKLDVDGTHKLYVANGNVHFTQEGRDATSDVATLDDANHHLHMEGHVHIRDIEQTLDSNVLDYDTLTGQLSAHGEVTIEAPVSTPEPDAADIATPAPKKKKH